jgi:hypothetical protein
VSLGDFQKDSETKCPIISSPDMYKPILDTFFEAKVCEI